MEKGGTILSLVPGGTAVKKGDLVCELDASGLNDRLLEETIAVKRAEGEYRTARLAHEAAMLAVKEYSEATYLLDKAATQCEIKLAESELAQASDHVDEVQRNFDKGTDFQGPESRHRAVVAAHKFALELAQAKMNHLEKFARPNTVKRLFGEVETTRGLEVAAKDILELRQAREQKTRRQIEACRIAAPWDGRVFHATRRARPGEGTNDVPVEEGDHVRERQVVVRVVPATP